MWIQIRESEPARIIHRFVEEWVDGWLSTFCRRYYVQDILVVGTPEDMLAARRGTFDLSRLPHEEEHVIFGPGPE